MFAARVSVTDEPADRTCSLWYGRVQSPVFRISEFGTRKDLLIKKHQLERWGALMLPHIRLKRAPNSAILYAKGRKEAQGKR